MISEASGSFHGCVINFLCTQTTVQGNLSLLTENICTALNLPEIHFNHFTDLFAFPGRQNQKYLIILDEYQYLKEGGRNSNGLLTKQLNVNITAIPCRYPNVRKKKNRFVSFLIYNFLPLVLPVPQVLIFLLISAG